MIVEESFELDLKQNKLKDCKLTIIALFKNWPNPAFLFIFVPFSTH